MADNQHQHQLYASDEEHSILEDDSEGEGQDEFMDEDDSSSLSIPNETIDFDLVYSLHTFVATVEGKANVVKGDSLFLMDDSNSYWWLVRVLKTQEVGYIPAENIETPYERLARLNKHRNVDLASATPEEMINAEMRANAAIRNSPFGNPNRRTVVFRNGSMFHYPPAVWNEDEEENWADGNYDAYEGEEHVLNDVHDHDDIHEDEEMSWDEEEDRNRGYPGQPVASVPAALQPGGARQTQPLAPQHPVQIQQSTGLGPQLVHQQGSREQLSPANEGQARNSPISPHSPGNRDLDSAEETIKVSATPAVAQDPKPQGPLLPSANLSRQQAEGMRLQQELAEASDLRKRNQNDPRLAQQQGQQPVASSGSSIRSTGGSSTSGKLTKQNSREKEREEEDKDKKKKGGLFGKMFGGGKDKNKDKDKADKGIKRPGSAADDYASRPSEESSSSRGPVSSMDYQQQPQQQQQQPRPAESQRDARNSTNPKSAISPHTLKLQQQDMQQYQQYLNSSSKREQPTQPSFGLQSASTFLPSPSNQSLKNANVQSGHNRPGSLILTSPGVDGSAILPELNVIRVFAGTHVQTEATFKTVLLNNHTTAAELVRQAMQRFRVASGEIESDYYLTIKQQFEGSVINLKPHEKPLLVFEELVTAEEAQALTMPKVKRASVGSISSVSSNLSMHPAIKKLPMNDFTDDSAVKFYLNRISPEGGFTDPEDSRDDVFGDQYGVSGQNEAKKGKAALSVIPTAPGVVDPERFTSPTARFSVQVLIYPEDLPDGIVFDPQTEAIVPKALLRERERTHASPGISQQFRKKVFAFPKNTTVAEVIEVSLERFGISDGVVDGGDEVEDKLAKRHSHTRVRYNLCVRQDSEERELLPSGRVLDSFTRPPSFRPVEQRRSDKRRSADASLLLGSSEDIQPGDPVFILRRAVAYRPTNNSRNRLSIARDEIGLYHAHRESLTASEASTATNDDGATPTPHAVPKPAVARPPPAQLSQHEIIAAQRRALRDKQKAIVSAQENSERGVDIVLPDNATLRSTRFSADEPVRYSYIEPTGETYDISEIMKEEWSPAEEYQSSGNDRQGGDLLEPALTKSHTSDIGEKIDRVLHKIKNDPNLVASTGRHPSIYLDNPPEENIVAPPSRPERAPSRNGGQNLGGRTTPTYRTNAPASISSNGSEFSSYDSSNPATPLHQRVVAKEPIPEESEYASSISSHKLKQPLVVKDDLGITRMIRLVESHATLRKPLTPTHEPLSIVDEMLFGPQLDVEELHPQARELYEPLLKRSEELDKELDNLFSHTLKLTSK